MNDQWKVWQYSPILWFFERFFRFLQYLPPQLFILHGAEDKQLADKSRAARRSIVVEIYLCICLIVDLSLAWLFLTGRISHWWVWIIMTLRITDIVQISVNVSVFDQLRRKHAVTSIRRSLVLTAINYAELIVCFGLLYATILPDLVGAKAWPDALYFSAITQLTIGYGDIHPIGFARVLAPVQAITGLVLIVVAFARVVTTLGEFEEIFKS